MSHHRKFTLTVSLYRFRGRFFFLLPAPSSTYSSWRGMRWSSNLMHVPPIAARPWWVWAQYWYNLHGPGPLGLWYGLDSGRQVGNGKHACESAPAVWHARGTVYKSCIHTGERWRQQLCESISFVETPMLWWLCTLCAPAPSAWLALLILDVISVVWDDAA